ncbi:MAG: hypothetical protein ACP5N3_04615 [Candidatus Nanoarchaeia archaeon]
MEKLREIDRKLVTGVLLTLGFLVLWLLTFPGQENALQKALVKTDPAVENEQRISDIDNFNRALILDNNIFCDRIVDKTTQAECKTTVVRRAELEAEKEIPPELIADFDNFNRALIMNTSSFCGKITDSELQEHCFKEVN